MGLTSLPKRGEGQVLGPIKAESSLNLWDRLRRVFTSEWNGNAKGLEEVCEEVGLHDGSTEGSLVARVNALEGGGGGGPCAPGWWHRVSPRLGRGVHHREQRAQGAAVLDERHQRGQRLRDFADVHVRRTGAGLMKEVRDAM